MYEKIKKWYRQGLWTEDMVRTAAAKGVITKENMAEMFGAEEGRNGID